MTASLQLMRFDPVRALLDDRSGGTDTRLALYRSVSPDAADERGRTMLCLAAEAADPQAVRLLLECGADPNRRDNARETPLTYAARAPRDWKTRPADVRDTVRALLRAGARPSDTDDAGRTAAFAALDRLLTPFFAAYAVEGIRTTERLPDSGFTLLHALCAALPDLRKKPHAEAVGEEEEALGVALLLADRLGVDKNARTAIGRTAREMAVRKHSRLIAPWLRFGEEAFGDTDEAALMLLSGGATAQEAALSGDAERIRALTALGLADDEPATEGAGLGLTPLSAAASVVAKDVVGLLLQAGADPTARINAKAPGGRETEGTSALRMLLWAPQYRSDLPDGLTADDWRGTLERLLSRPGAADAPVDPEGRTPLLTLAQSVGRGWRAAGEDWCGFAAEILLAHGADPNRAMPPPGIRLPFLRVPAGITPLGLLSEEGGPSALRIAEALLAAGADPNRADAEGVTPLMRAARLSSDRAEPFTERLLAAGADPTLRDNAGRTALDFASAAGNESVVVRLLATLEEPSEGTDATVAGSGPTEPEPTGTREASAEGLGRPSETSDTEVPPPTPGQIRALFAKMSAPEPKAPAPKPSADFFERIRSGRTQADRNAPPSDAAPYPKRPSDEAATADRTAALVGLLRILAEDLGRTETELRLLAHGLEAQAHGDESLLARGLADLLIELGLATEIDWKAEAEDFASALRELVGFRPVREAGFEKLVLDTEDDDDVPAMARRFEACAQRWGWPVRLTVLETDGDSYVTMLLGSLQAEPARRAAARAGLRLLLSDELH